VLGIFGLADRPKTAQLACIREVLDSLPWMDGGEAEKTE
jgi:hypothetical protein